MHTYVKLNPYAATDDLADWLDMSTAGIQRSKPAMHYLTSRYLAVALGPSFVGEHAPLIFRSVQ